MKLGEVFSLEVILAGLPKALCQAPLTDLQKATAQFYCLSLKRHFLVWRSQHEGFLQAVAGPNALILLCTAYVTDLISARNRAPALSLNMAAFGLAFALGPGIGGAVGTVLASWLSMAGVLATLVLMVFLVSESLSQEARAKASLPLDLSVLMYSPAVCICNPYCHLYSNDCSAISQEQRVK